MSSDAMIKITDTKSSYFGQYVDENGYKNYLDEKDTRERHEREEERKRQIEKYKSYGSNRNSYRPPRTGEDSKTNVLTDYVLPAVGAGVLLFGPLIEKGIKKFFSKKK